MQTAPPGEHIERPSRRRDFIALGLSLAMHLAVLVVFLWIVSTAMMESGASEAPANADIVLEQRQAAVVVASVPPSVAPNPAPLGASVPAPVARRNPATPKPRTAQPKPKPVAHRRQRPPTPRPRVHRELSLLRPSAPPQPTAVPTEAPTPEPVRRPTVAPIVPTSAPTEAPPARVAIETAAPTRQPTVPPTRPQTPAPTVAPTTAPTRPPTTAPTRPPTTAPTAAPTRPPTAAPTTAPTREPTLAPAVATTPATSSPATSAPAGASPRATSAAQAHAAARAPKNTGAAKAAAPRARSGGTAGSHAGQRSGSSGPHAPAPHTQPQLRTSSEQTAATGASAAPVPPSNGIDALNARLRALLPQGSANTAKSYGPAPVDARTAAADWEKKIAIPVEVLANTFGLIRSTRTLVRADSVTYVFERRRDLFGREVCRAFRITAHPQPTVPPRFDPSKPVFPDRNPDLEPVAEYVDVRCDDPAMKAVTPGSLASPTPHP